MKLVSYIFAAALAILGVVFVAGNQGVVLRIVVGAILLAASVALVVASRLRPRQTHLVQKIDLSGSIEAKAIACTKCGAQLDDRAIEVRAGAVFVSCPYCQASYRLEEAIKW
jgi:hypothetical protein